MGGGGNARLPVLLRTHCMAKLRRHCYRSPIQKAEHGLCSQRHSLKSFSSFSLRRCIKDRLPHVLLLFLPSCFIIFCVDPKPLFASAVSDVLLFSRFFLPSSTCKFLCCLAECLSVTKLNTLKCFFKTPGIKSSSASTLERVKQMNNAWS